MKQLYIVMGFFGVAVLAYVIFTSQKLEIRAISLGIIVLASYAFGYYESDIIKSEALKRVISAKETIKSKLPVDEPTHTTVSLDGD